MTVRVRPPQVAGLFYPGDPVELRQTIEHLLEAAPRRGLPGQLKALIVPHAGYEYSGPVAAVGYRLLSELDVSTPPTVLLLGPAHYVAFSGAAAHPADFWETPLGRVPVTNPGVPVSPSGPIVMLPEAHELEHSLEVQLPFLQVVWKDVRIWPLAVGHLPPASLADAVKNAVDRVDLVIVSSDLSHYHPYERASQIDALAHEVITALDIQRAERGLEACGKTAVATLLRIARGRGWQAHLLDYKNSGDTAGDRESVVGYGCYAFTA
jgi:AmmeMemoRadiSam system protein B